MLKPARDYVNQGGGAGEEKGRHNVSGLHQILYLVRHLGTEADSQDSQAAVSSDL